MHNIGDSCCVVQSDDEDQGGQEREFGIDHYGALQADKNAISLEAKSIGIEPGQGQRRKRSGQGLAVNSSRISEASSKYRISADGKYNEYRKKSVGANASESVAAVGGEGEQDASKRVVSSVTRSVNQRQVPSE